MHGVGTGKGGQKVWPKQSTVLSTSESLPGRRNGGVERKEERAKEKFRENQTGD